MLEQRKDCFTSSYVWIVKNEGNIKCIIVQLTDCMIITWASRFFVSRFLVSREINQLFHRTHTKNSEQLTN